MTLSPEDLDEARDYFCTGENHRSDVIGRALIAEVERLLARLDGAEGVIAEAKRIPHGAFGPWGDDLCDYTLLCSILSRAEVGK